MGILVAKTRRSRDILRLVEKSQRYKEVEKMIEEARVGDRAYWHSRTPQERIWALELMRQKAYGYDPETEKLQRVLEIGQLKKD
jgi:hypothetical protein